MRILSRQAVPCCCILGSEPREGHAITKVLVKAGNHSSLPLPGMRADHWVARRRPLEVDTGKNEPNEAWGTAGKTEFDDILQSTVLYCCGPAGLHRIVAAQPPTLARENINASV